MSQPIHFEAIVTSVDRHAEDVYTYMLASARRLPRFSPGQFIHLALDPYDPSSHWPESRVFSVANSVSDRRSIRLTIARKGAFTSRILSEVNEGTRVWCKGPYGEFIAGAHPESRVVLVAGGTGITPFCAFLDQALEEEHLPLTECILFYGVRKPELLIYKELADKCAKANPGFQVTYFVERGAEGSIPPSSRVVEGALNPDQIVSMIGGADGRSFYLSGPKAMIERFRASLASVYEVSPTRILVDAWE